MIILLPLLRKLPIRTRTRVGGLLVLAALVAAVVGAAAVPGLLVNAAIAAVVGLVFLASARRDRRRELGGRGSLPVR